MGSFGFGIVSVEIHKLQNVDDKLQMVDYKLQNVDDKLQNVDYKLQMVDDGLRNLSTFFVGGFSWS